MFCYTCQTQHAESTPATGFCVACGAAICADHTTVDPVLSQLTTLGNPVRSVRPGRALHCPECSAVLATGGVLARA